jgi:hypothetical protein
VGSPTVTNELDVCYNREPVNLEGLAAALRELKGRLRGIDEEVPLQLDATTLAKDQNFTFTTSLGPLDIIGMPAASGTSASSPSTQQALTSAREWS